MWFEIQSSTRISNVPLKQLIGDDSCKENSAKQEPRDSLAEICLKKEGHVPLVITALIQPDIDGVKNVGPSVKTTLKEQKTRKKEPLHDSNQVTLQAPQLGAGIFNLGRSRNFCSAVTNQLHQMGSSGPQCLGYLDQERSISRHLIFDISRSGGVAMPQETSIARVQKQS